MSKLEDKLSSRSPGRPMNDLAPTGDGSEGVAEPGAQAIPSIKARRPARLAPLQTEVPATPAPAAVAPPAPAPLLHPRRVWPD